MVTTLEDFGKKSDQKSWKMAFFIPLSFLNMGFFDCIVIIKKAHTIFKENNASWKSHQILFSTVFCDQKWVG